MLCWHWKSRLLPNLLVSMALGLLLLLSLAIPETIASGSSPCVVPVQMEGAEEGAEVPVARIKVGYTDETLRLALDFYSVGVTVSSHVPWMRSITYMAASGIDVVEMCHRRIRIPVRYDPEAAVLAGCPTCDGTLGLGRFNPLWMAWKSVTLSGGAMILDQSRKRSHVVSLSHGEPAKCIRGHRGFCLTEARIGDKTYLLDFAFQTQETYLPPEVYEKYVGIRSLEKDPPSSWKDLKMWVGDNKVVIGRDHIIPMSRLGTRKLLVKPNNNNNIAEVGNDTIVLGRAAWRALRVVRDTEAETITVVSWNCNRSHTSWGWLLLILAGLFLLRWKTTHDALWVRGNDGLYPDRILIEIFAAIIGFASYFLPSVREGLENFQRFSIYSIVVISTLVAWMIFTLAIYYSDKTEWIGDIFLVSKKPALPPNWSPPSPSFASHGAPLPPEMRRKPPPEGTLLLRFSPRVAIMRTMAVETILLLSTILLLNETREDTLAGLFPFLFTVGYLFILFYWGWLALYYTPNISPWLVWILWWIYYIVLVGTSAWVTAVEIVIPFFEREVPELVWPSEISAVMVYIFIAYWAARIGGDSVHKERARLYYLGIRYIGPFRIIRPGPGSTDPTVKAVVAYPPRPSPSLPPRRKSQVTSPGALSERFGPRYVYYPHQLGGVGVRHRRMNPYGQ